MENTDLGIHKSWLILILILIGMSMLFFSASVALIYLQVHQDLQSIKLPFLFYTNTFFLILSSFIFHKINPKLIRIRTLRYSLSVILTLSFCFLIFQGLAWYQLIANNISAASDRLAGFMYFFSFLHFTHVLGGLPFLIVFYIKMRRESTRDLLTVNHQREFKILRVYWHFIDLLWIYLVSFLSILIYFF